MLTKFWTSWRKNFLLFEGIAAFCLAGAFVLWAEAMNGVEEAGVLLKDNRSNVYLAITSICGSLLGFIITSVSLLIGFSGHERLKVVRESAYYADLWNTYTSAIRWLAAATVLAFVALIMDRDASPFRALMYSTFLSSLMAAFRVGRCLWVLEKIVHIVSRPPQPPQAVGSTTAS